MPISQGREVVAVESGPQCTSRSGRREWPRLLHAAPPTVLIGLVALLWSLLPAAEARAQGLAADRAALVALYNATDGPNWRNRRNWLSNLPLDQWNGVAVRNGRVTGLLLIGNRLKGRIPPELGNLSELERLSFSGNQLRGSIPSQLGKLANIKWLILSSNRLTGSIPLALSRLAQLERLILGSNQLTGSIPPQLGNIGKLRELDLGFNRLTGSVPSELGRLAGLELLILVANQLTGSIPPELGNLASLRELSLEQNQLAGPIPPELGNLANLQRLALSNNPLRGPIPPELGSLANLLTLGLTSSQLTGSIPPELGSLAKLETLSLMGNELTGHLPPELGNLSNLRHFFLVGNQLTGSLPPELGNLASLELLWFNKNRLSGHLPRELGNLANLQNLFVSDNQLTGSIPPQLGNLTDLELLWLSENQLTGPIPPEFSNLTKLRQLALGTNQLTGSIPPELGDLANLETLTMGGNRLTGSIPSQLGNLVSLQVLSVDTNRLAGPIPPELGDLASLDTLYLGDNRLTGSLPSELGKLGNLRALILDTNQLTEPIPLSFANLEALSQFRFFLNPGLCAGADRVIRNWLDDIGEALGPDCSPSLTLSVTPSDLVEGGGATSVMVTARHTPVSRLTRVHLLIGGTAMLGESHDYTLVGFSGSFDTMLNILTIPANSSSGTTVLTFVPRSDSLIEGTEYILLQAFVGGRLQDLQGAKIGGSAFLDLNDRVSCAARDRAALEALYESTGGTEWTNGMNWLSVRPLSEWYGVTVDFNGCVTQLDLSNNHLTGTLPSQLGDLVHLEGLDLRGNRLTGMVPPSFTNLEALLHFRFHRNSGLCAQADTSIRTWLNGIGDVRGPDCSSVFVPVLLASAGRKSSFFTSELTLTNRGAEEAVLHYTYTVHEGGRSGTATDGLAPGRQRIQSDALGYLMGLGVPIPETGNRIGTLRVEVSGSSSVSVVARTTTAVPEGRAGLAYPGIPEAEGFHEPVYLCGLRQNTRDRSNVALQNMGVPGDGPITLRTTLFSGEADDITSRLVGEETLPPGGFHQYSGLLGRLSSPAQGYVKVEKIEGDAPFYAYGVINDNFNSDGSFVFPVTESSLVGARGQTLPVVVETGNFQSELTVTNFSTADKTIDFSFVADGVATADDTAGFSLEIKAGEQRILPNLVSWLREEKVDGIGPAGRTYVGALFATPAEGDLSGIVIGARTGSPDNRGGQYSLFNNAVPYGAASLESAWVYGLQQNEENRSNLALVNTGEIDDSPSTFEITIFEGSGQSQPRIRSVTLGPRRWRQINGILGRIGQGYVRVRKTSGNNPFVAYGVINDGGRPGERSGDGAYLPGRE